MPLPPALSAPGAATVTAVVLVPAAPALMVTVPVGAVLSDAGSGMWLCRKTLALPPAADDRLLAVTTMPVDDVTTCLVVDASSMRVSVALLMNGRPRWMVASAGPRKTIAPVPLSRRRLDVDGATAVRRGHEDVRGLELLADRDLRARVAVADRAGEGRRPGPGRRAAEELDERVRAGRSRSSACRGRSCRPCTRCRRWRP